MAAPRPGRSCPSPGCCATPARPSTSPTRPARRRWSQLVDAAVGRGDVVVSVGGDGMLSSLAGLVAAPGRHPRGRPRRPRQRLRPDARPARRPGSARRGCCCDAAPRAGRPARPSRSGRGRGRADGRRLGLRRRRRPRGRDRRPGATWLPRKLQYPYAALRSLATYRPGRYVVVGRRRGAEYDAATVVVANSAYYGKGMQIAPARRGRRRASSTSSSSRPPRGCALMRSLPKVYDGAHVELPEVTVLRGHAGSSSRGRRSRAPIAGRRRRRAARPAARPGPRPRGRGRPRRRWRHLLRSRSA